MLAWAGQAVVNIVVTIDTLPPFTTEAAVLVRKDDAAVRDELVPAPGLGQRWYSVQVTVTRILTNKSSTGGILARASVVARVGVTLIDVNLAIFAHPSGCTGAVIFVQQYSRIYCRVRAARTVQARS